MPQLFQVLRCYKCSVFQGHQTKKSNKFECKICGEKQSIKRHYGLGTAKDCRMHVQKLNGIRGEIMEHEHNINSDEDDISQSSNNEDDKVHGKPILTHINPLESKWSQFIDNKEEIGKIDTGTDKAMFLGDAEVVLEHPNKESRKRKFKCPENNLVTSNKLKTPSIQSLKNKLDLSPTASVFSKPNKIVNRLKIVLSEHNLSEYPVESKDSIVSKRYTAPSLAMDSGSKWAQFLEDEETCEEDKQEESSKIPYLFALCDDHDLDEILDI